MERCSLVVVLEVDIHHALVKDGLHPIILPQRCLPNEIATREERIGRALVFNNLAGDVGAELFHDEQHVSVSVSDSVINGRPLVEIFGIQLRTVDEQQLGDLRMPFGCRKMERRSLVVIRVHGTSATHQLFLCQRQQTPSAQLHELLRKGDFRIRHRLAVALRAIVLEKTNNFQPPETNSFHHRRRSPPIRDFDVRAILHQKLHDFGVPRARREMNRRSLIIIHVCRGGTLLDQFLHELNVAFRACVHERHA
mmetsp:Transcript_9720/g.24438  ORF Transcript_9720/g.24438 Transcript_9720/m.24438 type:complete len:252 (-) Transcript_9720:1888-2643(-)